MEDKTFELMEKMYIEFTEEFQKVNEKLDQKADKSDIVRIENDYGEKLSALFDGYQSITETLDDHTKRLERIENKLETHDTKIHVLDKTKANIK